MKKLKISRKGTIKNKELGITLIALVISIVVLLILAGISIQMLTGNNGILVRAGEAKVATEKVTTEEKIKLEVLGSIDTKGTINSNKLKSALTSMGAEVKGTELPFFVALDGVDYTISEDGTTIQIGKNDMNLVKLKAQVADLDARIEAAQDEEELAEAKAAKTAYYQGIYGSVVDYGKQITTSLTGVANEGKWKVFYIGSMGEDTESHIYLISDSYINNSTSDFPTKTVITNASTTPVTTTTYSFSKNGAWKTYFNSIFATYTGAMLESNYATVNEMKNLNSKYFVSYTGVGYNNMKSVASMLDTNIWSTYMDSTTNGNAQYVIGGPTIEMLFKSYNQTHGTDFGAKAPNATGYQITRTQTANTGWADAIDSMLSTNANEPAGLNNNLKKLYVVSNTGADAYWLASPSAKVDWGNYCGYVMKISYNGNVDFSSYNYNTIGFRPIVCLKSNVQLVEASVAKKEQGIDFELK